MQISKKIEPSSAYMVVDTLTKILNSSDDISKLSDWLVSEIREMTGAKLVLLISKDFDSDQYKILKVNPERKREYSEKDEIRNIILKSFQIEEISELHIDQFDESVRKFLLNLGYDANIIIPLKANNEVLGSILALGLPGKNNFITITNTYRNLTVLLGLVFRNASLIENQDRIIQERTKELIAAKMTVDEICQRIGADSLGYLSLEGVVRAVDPPPGIGFCSGCFDHNYPFEMPEE